MNVQKKEEENVPRFLQKKLKTAPDRTAKTESGVMGNRREETQESINEQLRRRRYPSSPWDSGDTF